MTVSTSAEFSKVLRNRLQQRLMIRFTLIVCVIFSFIGSKDEDDCDAGTIKGFWLATLLTVKAGPRKTPFFEKLPMRVESVD
jgi:hypothetical protein